MVQIFDKGNIDEFCMYVYKKIDRYNIDNTVAGTTLAIAMYIVEIFGRDEPILPAKFLEK